MAYGYNVHCHFLLLYSKQKLKFYPFLLFISSHLFPVCQGKPQSSPPTAKLGSTELTVTQSSCICDWFKNEHFTQFRPMGCENKFSGKLWQNYPFTFWKSLFRWPFVHSPFFIVMNGAKAQDMTITISPRNQHVERSRAKALLGKEWETLGWLSVILANNYYQASCLNQFYIHCCWRHLNNRVEAIFLNMTGFSI